MDARLKENCSTSGEMVRCSDGGKDWVINTSDNNDDDV